MKSCGESGGCLVTLDRARGARGGGGKCFRVYAQGDNRGWNVALGLGEARMGMGMA